MWEKVSKNHEDSHTKHLAGDPTQRLGSKSFCLIPSITREPASDTPTQSDEEGSSQFEAKQSRLEEAEHGRTNKNNMKNKLFVKSHKTSPFTETQGQRFDSSAAKNLPCRSANGGVWNCKPTSGNQESAKTKMAARQGCRFQPEVETRISRSRVSSASGCGGRREVTSSKRSAKSKRARMLREQKKMGELVAQRLAIRIPGLNPGNGGVETAAGAWDYTDTWINLKGRSERWIQRWNNSQKIQKPENARKVAQFPSCNIPGQGRSKVTDTARSRLRQRTEKLRDNCMLNSKSGRPTSNFEADGCNDLDNVSSVSRSVSVLDLDGEPGEENRCSIKRLASFRGILPEIAKPETADVTPVRSSAARGEAVLPFISDEACRIIEELRLDRVRQELSFVRTQEPPGTARFRTAPTSQRTTEQHKVELFSVLEQTEKSTEHELKQSIEGRGHALATPRDQISLLDQTRPEPEVETIVRETDAKRSPDGATVYNSTVRSGGAVAVVGDRGAVGTTPVQTRSCKVVATGTAAPPSVRRQTRFGVNRESALGFGGHTSGTNPGDERRRMLPLGHNHVTPEANRKPVQLVKSRSAGAMPVPKSLIVNDVDARSRGYNGKDNPGVITNGLRDYEDHVMTGSFHVTPAHYDCRFLDYVRKPCGGLIRPRQSKEVDESFDEEIAEAVIKCSAWLRGQRLRKAVDL